LNPFAAWISAKPVFIIWRGSDKSPIDPLHRDPQSSGLGGAGSNAQNPATWLTWEIANAYAQSLGDGYGVGIVIHEGSGLLCVDIDGCITDGVVSELGTRLVREARAACPDTYVEVSMSGRGIHIIGPYKGVPPPHSTKNKELHVELYTSARYIALTGKPCPQI
jgi:primase-polymerase (primpol)-like protein